MNTRTLLATCIATLFASNAQAVAFPPVPLESGAQYPPPNVMFILDDSGSMNFVGMPENLTDPADFTNYGGGTRTIDPSLVQDASYVHNSIHYNPATTYLPWMTHDGTNRLANGDYTSASRDTDNLGDNVDLRLTTQSYYTPKTAGTTSTDPADYYRWFLVGDDAPAGRRGQIWRTEAMIPAGYPDNDSDANSGMLALASVSVPANVVAMEIRTSGGTHGDNNSANNLDGGGADLYVRAGSAPTTGAYDARSTGNSNDEYVRILSPASGTWHLGLQADSRYRNVVVTVMLYGNGSETLPNPARTVAQEKANYATWYTYHRTRMKVAKAGASEAFTRIGENLRIGFDSINRSSANATMRIPVGNDDGLFRGSNKTTWYTTLQGEGTGGGTPLHGGLHRTGKYFQDTASADSPWKTSSSNDLIACRQNFAILTTDGYWNSVANYPDAERVGDADGTSGTTITGAKGETFTYTPGNPYRDNTAHDAADRANTLADVAMHYWKTDLTNLPNNVPVTTEDPAFWQHMVTFGVSIGLNGTLNPAVDLPALKLGSKKWPNVWDNSGAERIDDLWHASVNGRGDFVVVGNSEEFAQGLTDAFTLVAARQGSASNVTANSTSFTADTRVFQASYVSGRWNGELLAYDATAAGVGATPLWRASDGLSGTRKFFTWDTTGGAAFPTSAQSTALDVSTRPIGPATSAENVAYLKGTRTLERQNGGGLRDRTSALGDIVNSSPFYVKDTNTIYVGANDGMLHAINAATGVELFAYVPKGINLADLASLSHPNYIHRYFVDGPVVVTTREQTPAKNYLIGTLGRGGRGVFGLDVTEPATFTAAQVLWETTHADLGNVMGEPLIATTNGGEKVAIVGNGLNSDNGNAVLFVIDVTDGDILYRLDTGVGTDNGLFAPRGWDNDGNGTVDFVYAADREGHLWKFDFTGATPSIDLGGSPLFTTASGQPVTTGVAIAKDASTGKRWVFMGSGSYMTSADPTDVTVQSIYGIIDDDTTVARTDLQERDILVSTLLNGRRVRGFAPNASLPGAKKGWFVDLDTPTPGERIVTRPQVRGSVLLFSSRIPPTDNTCDAGGAGFLNGIDAFTGTSTTQAYFDANKDGTVNGSDSVTQGGNTVPVGSVDLGIGMPTLPTVIDQLVVVGGSTGTLGSIKINPLGGVARRASWHELEGD